MRIPIKYHLRREWRTLAYLQDWGETIKQLEEGGDVSKETARGVFKLLSVAARGLCDPEPEKKMMLKGGRGGTRRKRRQIVAAAATAFGLGMAGGMAITHTLSELFFGASGGQEFQEYKKRSEKRDVALRNDIARLAEKIKELKKMEAVSLVVAQIQLMAEQEQEEWYELTKKNTANTRGDVVLKSLLQTTINEWKKKGLLNVTSGPFKLDGPFELDPSVYKIEILGVEMRYCRDAKIGLNLVSAVPSTKCYKILNETSEYTILDNSGGGCLIAAPRNSTTTLVDGSLFTTSATWDSKRKPCSTSYLDNYNIGFSNGLVLLGGKYNQNGSYYCGRNFGLKDVKLPRKAGSSLHFPCRGQLGEGNTSANFYSVDVDIVDDNGYTGIKLDGTEHRGFYVDRNIFSKIEDEDGGLETADYCTWNDCGGQMEKAVGSTFAIIVGGGLVAALVVVTRIWLRKRKDISTTTSFYRRGSSVSDEDELSKVVAMTNSLAMIGKNMTNMVLALEHLGPVGEDYAGEVEEEQIGEEEEGQDG